jgi:hypothetical protein
MKYFLNNPKSLLKDNNTFLSHLGPGTLRDTSRFALRGIEAVRPACQGLENFCTALPKQNCDRTLPVLNIECEESECQP